MNAARPASLARECEGRPEAVWLRGTEGKGVIGMRGRIGGVPGLRGAHIKERRGFKAESWTAANAKY